MNELEKLIYQKLNGENDEIGSSINTQADTLDSSRENLDIIQQNMNNSSIKPFLHKGIIGKIIIFIKKVIRKLTKFYLEPFANQQTEFNIATYKELEKDRAENIALANKKITELANKITTLENQNFLTSIDYGNINEKTETLSQTLINVSKKYEELYNKINALSSDNNLLKDELNNRINTLSSDNNLLKDELNNRINTLSSDNNLLKDELNNRINTLSSDNNLLKDELNNRINTLSSDNNLLKDELNNRINTLSSDNNLLKDELNNRINTLSSDNNLLKDELNNRINTLSSDNNLLKDELVKHASSFANRNLTKQSYNPMEYKTTYSQSGEDAIIKYILFELQRYEKVSYLDLGANHAKEISNTYGLYEAGASGVLVEANPYLITELELYRNRDVILNKCISAKDDEELEFYIFNGDGLSTPDYESAQKMLEINEHLFIKDTVKVKTISINTIIDNYFKDRVPEVVNIDIEGMEMEVLQQIDFEKFRPLIYIIETIPYTKDLVKREKTEEVIDFMNKKGYVEYAFTGINSIFIDERQLGNK